MTGKALPDQPVCADCGNTVAAELYFHEGDGEWCCEEVSDCRERRFDDALAEASRLRTEVEALKADRDKWKAAYEDVDAIHTMRYAENEKLRETLKLIAEADVALFTGKSQRPSGEFCVNAAKRALGLDEQGAQ